MGSQNGLISSLENPIAAMICHWYFSPPVLAFSLP